MTEDLFADLRKNDPEREAKEAAVAAGRKAKLAKAEALAQGDLVAAAMVEVQRIDAELKSAEEAEGEMLFRLTSGTGAPVSQDAYEKARRDVQFLAQQLTGAWAKVERAKDEMRIAEMEQLADEIAEFADDTNSPARRAAKAYKAAAASLREALDAVNEHNAAVNTFKTRARALDAKEARGSAYPDEPVGLDGSKLVSGPYELSLLDSHKLAAYAVLNASTEIRTVDASGFLWKLSGPYKDVNTLAATVSGTCNRDVPNAEQFYYRTAEGHSVAYNEEPGLVEVERLGLKKIPHDDVWDWGRRVKR
ncbi:hypothetical protein ACTWJ8_30745 [Streptomyces sp. SDT5-1]|uniref:hypothetical protein n=1 Tax=Streptomyces sp. SDT5-1 TaxID=3406418 RepID=UPI003FD3D3AD